MTTTRDRAGRLVAFAVLVAAVGGSTACSGSDDASSDGGSTTAAAPDQAAGVPEACAKPFPQAFAEPDLAEVTLAPDGFPEPPVDATLCLTTSTVDNSQESVSYATEASTDEVLAGYESALSAYSPSRETDGVGRPILVAQDGELTVQVTPKAGGFVIAFANA